MSRLGFALLLLAVSPAYAERPVDGYVPFDESMAMPEPPVTPAGLAPYNKIYLNRCANGCSISFGNTASSITNSWPVQNPGVLSKFPYPDDVWNKVVACFKDVMSPYNVEIVETSPGSTNHFEIMIAGSPTDLGFQSNVGGVAPPGCTKPYYDNALVFDFATVWGSSGVCGPRCIEEICSTAAQEIGHTWQQMDHVIVKEDPMTYAFYTGRRYFQNTAGQCGSDCVNGKGPGGVTCSGTNNQNHVCRCTNGTAQTQNSVSVIEGLFGKGPGTPPTVEFMTPATGTTVQKGFKLYVNATDDSGIVAKVELKIDGAVVDTLTAAPYTFTSPLTLAAGAHHVEAIAYDGPGTPGSAAIDVVIGPPCESASDCPNATDACVSGRCVAGPNATGGLGTTCTDATQCASQFCAGDGTSMYCVEPCMVGDCPSDFGCVDDGSGKGTGVCWPGYDDGSGGCGCESNRPGGALSFGLLFAVTVFTWRRRRSSAS